METLDLDTETQGTEPQQSTQPTRPIWLIILTVSLPMFMASLDNLIVTNALPVIGKELGATFEQLSWFVNAYTLAFASLVLTSSGVADRCGRRCIFSGGPQSQTAFVQRSSESGEVFPVWGSPLARLSVGLLLRA